LQGRTDDAITIGSTHWSYDEITLPLTKHLQEQKGKISSNYAIQLQQIEHRTQMTIQYQPMNATKQEIETLEEKIEIYMNKEHPIVSPLVKKGILFSVQVQRIDNFETLKNPQTGKIRFVRYI
jgi:adenine-specific DNA methylase